MTKTKRELEEENNKLNIKNEVFEAGDKRWASKLTEIIVYGLCGLILVGAVATLLSLIYK